MFDRLIFDSGKFDRETNDGYEGILSAEGAVICRPTVITPLQHVLFTSLGKLNTLYPAYIVYTDILISNSVGQIRGANPDENHMDFILVLPLTITLTSSGDMDILNIGDAVVSVLDLRNINLLPNQTITIDTDAMVVLFGLVHDVSSLTSDSEFFELDKGTNELRFEIGYEVAPNPMPADELDTIFIWQNRWL